MLTKKDDFNETLVSGSAFSLHLWLRVISHHVCLLLTDDVTFQANGKMSKTHKTCISLHFFLNIKDGGFSRITAVLQHNSE